MPLRPFSSLPDDEIGASLPLKRSDRQGPLARAGRVSRIFCTRDIIGYKKYIWREYQYLVSETVLFSAGPLKCLGSPAAIRRAIVQRHHEIGRLCLRARLGRRQMGVTKNR